MYLYRERVKKKKLIEMYKKLNIKDDNFFFL
jgi:hypothetical protein